MRLRRNIIILVLSTLSLGTFAQEAMNRPYIDDRLYHFGFQVGMNFTAFGVTDRDTTVRIDNDGRLYEPHARVSSVLPGVHVNFIADLRLSKHVNLRFCPGIQFSERTLKYKLYSGNDTITRVANALAIPINFPLYLKFSADRQSNYRPYVIAGGGVSLNAYQDKNKPIMLKVFDAFCEVGFGVDFYLPWFKLCPELTYRIGFMDLLCPISEHEGGTLSKNDYFYTDAISRLTSHCICLTFNFE